MPDPKIYAQIESTADFNPPGTYAFNPASFLTYYNDLTVAQDPLADFYIPLSAVAQRGVNPKMFAIGVIPPSVNLTGNLLARVSAPDSSEYNVPSNSTVAAPAIPANISPLTANTLKGLTPATQAAALALIQVAAMNGLQLEIANGFRDTKAQTAIYAQGRTAPGPIVSYAKPGTSPHEKGMAFDVAVNKNGKPTWPNDNALWAQIGQYGESVGLTWGGRFPELNPGQPADLDHFQISKNYKGPPAPDVTAVVNDAVASDWQKNGSDQSQVARQQQQKLANTPLTADEAGKALLAGQRAQLLAVKAALDAMANSPPLRMLVNPKSFSVKGEKIVSDGNWGRNGPIIEHWGNNQDKISASGKVTGFYAISTEDAVGPGLTRMARNFSQAWQNFQSLYLFYKNNGALYTQDFASSSNQLNLTLVGSIYIYYDNILYIGSFDNFSLSEDDSAPYSMDYSYDFTVRAAFLLDQPDTLTYGRATVPNAAPLIQTTSTATTSPILTGINGPF